MNVMTDYQIIAKIYESENSSVYRAIGDRNNQPIILKILKQDYPAPSELTRYKQEYELIRSLDLDGVVKAYDLRRYQNSLVMLLEDFGGESLKSWTAERQLTLEEFLTIAIKIAESLGAIHAANIIHKDINPSNLVYNPESGQLKIIDFGISTVLSRENPTLRNPDRIEGTLAYISPEQTGRMNRAIDYRTDFYSLGVTFYELLTHQLPFETNDALELVHSHIAKQPVPPHELVRAHGRAPLPTIVSDIVMKLMAKTAEERYQSAWGLKADLETCLHQLKTSDRISEFPLGNQDVSDKFQIPQKLYGREEEVETLLAAFERVSGQEGLTTDNGQLTTNKSEMILVAGYSGIGKSALVNEVHKPIVRQRGYFISGKFDQFKRDIPYASLIQAFQELIRQLLTESEAQLQTWKQKLLDALGSNAQVIIDVIPEVELIIGEQPPVPQLGSTESQNRFNLVFQNFIGVFTNKEHPLVIFLDDLQWADSASLKLIQLLMTDSDSQYLLMIGAYRDNEVSPTHPLMQTLEQIQQTGTRVSTITLQPLGIDCVNQLIADTLNSSTERSKLLAELAFNKTNGNPFFLTQLLQFLYTEHLLSFELSTGCWQWDIERIRAVGITDNVVELMVSKIEKLDEKTQNVLKLAACVGNRFNLDVLSVVSAKSLSETAAELWSALQEGLIVPLSDDYKIPMLWNQEVRSSSSSETSASLIPNFSSSIPYKFLHDRVQQAAYVLIPDDHKKEVHLKVGQLLLKNTKQNELEENIFDIVNQLNIGSQLLTQQLKRDELAGLNLMAGKKAKAATAYQAAIRYLNLGLELLGSDSWQNQYELTLELHVETIEAEYLNTNFEQAETLSAIVLQHAKTLLNKVKVYELNIQSYIAKLQYKIAIDTALQVLAQLGVVLPQEPSKWKINKEQRAIELLLKDKQIEDLANLPEMTDPYKLAAIRIFLTIISATYVTNPPLFSMMALSLVNLFIKYGNSSLAAAGYTLYSLFLCGQLEDYESGYRFSQLSLRLLEQFNVRQLTASVLMMQNSQVRHWKDHAKTTTNSLLEALNSAFEHGNLEFCGLASNSYCANLFYAGEHLNKLEQETNKYLNLVVKLKQEYSIYYALVYRQVVLNLLDRSSDPCQLIGGEFNELDAFPLFIKTQNYCTLYQGYTVKSILLFLFKNYALALEVTNLGKLYESSAAGMLATAELNFYESLSLLALCLNEDEVNKIQFLKQVSSNQKRMKKWAFHAPVNYQHKYELVEAEKARVLGKSAKAMDYYDRAIRGASKQGYIQEEAIAYERAAEFYLSLGREEIGQFYMKNAYQCYASWGATAKVKALEAEYPQLLVGATNRTGVKGNSTTRITSASGSNAQALDLETVVKASQALAGEIVLDKLLAKLMKIAIENAGAQKGFLILETEGNLAIAASGTVDSDEVKTLQSIPINSVATSTQMPLLSGAIVNYVARTKENVVLNDALNEGQFTSDLYIVTTKPKSILCTALLNQGKLSGILYLENNLTTGAFTSDRLEILNLLSSQAAISIENATLYNNLEQKVQERTLELEQEIVERKRAEDAAQAANQAKSTFLANMSHELRSPLNAILGFSQLMIRSRSLSSENQENIGIITRSGEHLLTLINQVLDLSKIEAGRTTLNETNFDLYRLLDDVEDMFHLKADDKRLQLICDRAPDVPRYVRTDEVKLRQVLINLLNNALKFTQEGGVSVRVGMKNGQSLIANDQEKASSNEQLAISFEVEDTGEGIAPEELDSLFEAFMQTKTGKDSQEGTGLGLAISRKFIQLMGGEISVNSEVGCGTIFKFDITVNVVDAKDIESKQPTRRVIALEPNQQSYRILIVDDKLDNRQLLIKLLNPLGFELKEASNGIDAVEIWDVWEPHLIWMDMRMPVMDGYEATKQIKSTTKGQATAVIALTASVLEEERAVVLSAGCDDFLRKPFRETNIFELMNKHIGVRYVYDESTDVTASTVSKTDIQDALKPEALVALPTELLANLEHVASFAYMSEIDRYIDEIRSYDATVADALTTLALDFEYGLIVTLIQQAKQ